MSEESTTQKVYSPDIKPYSFEGRNGAFNTLLSFVVGPIRLVSRVMHNIFILPANLYEDYADALLLTSLLMEALGVFDFIFYKKWPLVVSQLPAIYFALRLKKQARSSTIKAQEKREVDINVQQVEKLCNTVYDELSEVIKE